jgi:hypothetical protein
LIVTITSLVPPASMPACPDVVPLVPPVDVVVPPPRLPVASPPVALVLPRLELAPLSPLWLDALPGALV